MQAVAARTYKEGRCDVPVHIARIAARCRTSATKGRHITRNTAALIPSESSPCITGRLLSHRAPYRQPHSLQ